MIQTAASMIHLLLNGLPDFPLQPPLPVPAEQALPLLLLLHPSGHGLLAASLLATHTFASHLSLTCLLVSAFLSFLVRFKFF